MTLMWGVGSSGDRRPFYAQPSANPKLTLNPILLTTVKHVRLNTSSE